jgi:hypothetical protein
MNTEHEQDRGLSTLLSVMLDGQMTAAEESRLGDLLRDNPAAQEVYLDCCRTHALLRQELGGRCDISSLAGDAAGSADETPSLLGAMDGRQFSIGNPPACVPFPSIVIEAAVDRAPQFSPLGGLAFSYSLAALIVGVGMLIGWACKVSVHERVANAPPTAPAILHPESRMVFVGRVTGTVDCRWSDPKTATVDCAYVPLGRKYALDSGLMEITYDSGAAVILEGPCVYTVESKTSGRLYLGRLTARVEKKAEGGRRRAEDTAETSIGRQQTGAESPSSPFPLPPSPFVVRTPTATVTDLGTEFGVEVDKSGQTDSHVFRGKVLVVAVGSSGQRQDREITLAADESARVEKAVGAKALVVRRGNVKVNPASFVRGQQFAARTKEIRELPLKPLRRWQAFSEQLRKRSDLLAYYDFQRDPGDPRDRQGYELLRNRAPTGSKFDGRLVGAIKMGMAGGRFPGKDSLRFDYAGDGVRINIPGEFPQLTLMVAISLERCNGYSGILMTDGWERSGQFHWQFVKAGTIKLGFPRPDGDFQLDAREAADFAQWHLWTAVYDAPGGRVASYVDGRLLGEWKLAKGPSLTIGEATIGNWKPLEAFVSRPLSGSIDELAIFVRALGAADIKQLQEGETETQQQ